MTLAISIVYLIGLVFTYMLDQVVIPIIPEYNFKHILTLITLWILSPLWISAFLVFIIYKYWLKR